MGWKFSNENPIWSFRQMPQQKAGGILRGSFSRGEMVKGGEAFSYKCSRITEIKIWNLNFHKEFVILDHSCSSRQQSCSSISLEDWWYPQSKVSKNQEINLKLSAISSDHNYCRVPSNQVECQSRQGVQEGNRLFRLETSSESLSENNQTLRNPDSRYICLQAASSTSPIHGMEAWSKQFCNRCSASGLEQNVWFCISTLQLDRSGDKQGSRGICRGNDTSDTYTADTTLVYSPTKNVHATSIASTSPPKPISKSPGRKTSSCKNQVSKVSGVEN